MSQRKEYIIALSSLICGCFIYLFFRKNIIGLEVLSIDTSSLIIEIEHNIVTDIIIYNLPDALWFFSLILFQVQFYKKSNLLSKVILYACIALPFIGEIMQKHNIISGTFDIIDVVLYALVLIIVMIWKRKKLFT
ncbi:MAG: hypothetical protein IJA28_03975 [Coprobacter sp.]|nr:hypothetical protein [Coprobacter sp.]